MTESYYLKNIYFIKITWLCDIYLYCFESSINVIHQYWVWIIKTNLILKYLSVDDIPWVPLLLRAFTFLWLIKLVVILCYVQYWDFKERVLVVIVVVLLYIVFVCYRRHQSFFLSRSAICAIYIPRVLNRFHFIEWSLAKIGWPARPKAAVFCITFIIIGRNVAMKKLFNVSKEITYCLQ